MSRRTYNSRTIAQHTACAGGDKREARLISCGGVLCVGVGTGPPARISTQFTKSLPTQSWETVSWLASCRARTAATGTSNVAHRLPAAGLCGMLLVLSPRRLCWCSLRARRPGVPRAHKISSQRVMSADAASGVAQALRGGPMTPTSIHRRVSVSHSAPAGLQQRLCRTRVFTRLTSHCCVAAGPQAGVSAPRRPHVTPHNAVSEIWWHSDSATRGQDASQSQPPPARHGRLPCGVQAQGRHAARQAGAEHRHGIDSHARQRRHVVQASSVDTHVSHR